MHRRSSAVVLLLGIGAVLEQLRHVGGPIEIGGEHERRDAVFVRRIRVAAARSGDLQQRGESATRFVATRPMNGESPVAVSDSRIGSMMKEQLQKWQCGRVSGLVQRRRAAVVLLVYRASGSNEEAGALEVNALFDETKYTKCVFFRNIIASLSLTNTSAEFVRSCPER